MPSLAPLPKFRFFTAGGTGTPVRPLVGGKVYFYEAGTTTPKDTYTSSTGLVANTNPVILNSRGEADIWLGAGSYKMLVTDENDVAQGGAVDNIKGSDQLLAEAGALVTALRDDLANDSDAAKGAGMVAHSYANNYAVGTLGWTAAHTLGIDVTQEPFLADLTGASDCTAALAAARAAFPGVPLNFPKGTYRFDSTQNLYPASFSGAFGAGDKIYGDGIGVTIFDTRAANGPLFNLDANGGSHAVFQAPLGAEFHGFTILTNAAPANATGIKIRASYMVKVSQVRIVGLSAHGIELPCTVGDNDGANMVSLEHVRIEDCAGWGVKADGDAGRNELSYLHMKHCFIQNCGTASGSATPPSGGMIWKGQVLKMEQTALTINKNCPLFIPGQAGLAQSVELDQVSFENNLTRGGPFVTGVSSFKATGIQIYNNNSFVATVGLEMDGASFSIRQVDINGAVVRATSSNNPYTAFKISGANADLKSCRVRNVVWDNYDYTGQVRFAGWLFDQIRQDCDVVAASAVQVTFRPNSAMGRGNVSPFRLRGGSGGAPSSTGEWVELHVGTSGYSIGNGGLAVSTRYYAYLYDNGGVPAIELSTTATTVDSATGYPVKTGDATRLYVGSVATDGASQFLLTASGWLNPLLAPGSQPGVYTRMWTDSTGDLRVLYASDPTSDVDGVVVGTQT